MNLTDFRPQLHEAFSAFSRLVPVEPEGHRLMIPAGCAGLRGVDHHMQTGCTVQGR
jgi:hypothetical protein